MRTSSRRRSRELVLQGLYQRQLSGNAAGAVRDDLVAIGRVADNRFGITACDQEAKRTATPTPKRAGFSTDQWDDGFTPSWYLK